MGSPVIWFGNVAKNLKAGLKLSEFATVFSGSADPSVTATTGAAGDIYISTSTFKTYQKQDAGSTTNWTDFSTHDPVTLAAVGGAPNANGASLSDQVLNLQPADGTFPGVVSITSQTFTGIKTFALGIKDSTLTTNRVVVTDGAQQLVSSTTTATELGYVTGVTSAIQTQLNNRGLNSAGDLNETSYAILNNQSSPVNFGTLAFANATVRSFDALVSVFIDATSDLYEVFELRGIQRGADWAMSVTSTGDPSLIEFSITTAGQVQYTTPDYAGFSAGAGRFRARTTSVA